MITIGVVGYGYWGPNLVRNFFSLKTCKVKRVVDSVRSRLNDVKKYYPSILATNNLSGLFNDSSIDAVVIATPISSHFALAKKALQHDKHVLVEKPITASLPEARELITIAKKRKKVLMVDHTFLYTDAVQKIKKLIEKGEIGKLRYFDSTRTNLGLFQKDVNVLWDLASHDISILLYLVKEKPRSIQVSAVSHTKNQIENIAFMTIKYRSGFIVHLKCSWSSPVKIRLTFIGGTKRMIVYNDVEPTEKVKIYDSSYTLRSGMSEDKFRVDYRVGDVHIPKIELFEGLREMAKDFIHSIETGKKPLSDWQHGLEVVKMLSLAEESIRNGEKPVYYEKKI